MSTYAVLREAVLAKKQVVCWYQGYERSICPHVLGTKRGREQTLAFQFAGGSKTGLPPGGRWRCMVVAEIANATLRDGDWHTGDDHSRPQTCVDVIDVEVSF